MRITEPPQRAELARIRKALAQELPNRSAAYLVPLLAGLLFSLVTLGALVAGGARLGASWGWWSFQPDRLPALMAGAMLLSLAAGRWLPRPDFRDSGTSWGKRRQDRSGCLGMIYRTLAGTPHDALRFLLTPPALGPADLDIAASLVQTCLAHPGVQRAPLVRHVTRRDPRFFEQEVDRVLSLLQGHGLISGSQALRVPPSRARDFGAVGVMLE